MGLIDKLLHREQEEGPVVEEEPVWHDEPVVEKVIDPLDAERNLPQEGVPSFL